MDRRAKKYIIRQTALLFCAFLFVIDANAEDVAFVLSKDAPPYQQFVSSAEKSLQNSPLNQNITYRVLQLDDYLENPNGHKLVVAVGTTATRKVVESGTDKPILSTLIPSSVYHDIENKAAVSTRQHMAGVFIDQPFERYIEFIKLVNPNLKKVGILSSKNNKQINQVIEQYPKSKEITILHATVKNSEEVIQSLDKILEGSDVFLTLADPVVLNRSTAHAILLSAYHRKVPVVSYLKSFVKAGALTALYSTPEELGKQVGEYLIEFVSNNFVFTKKEQYPRYYSISVNNRVAHSLGFDDINKDFIRDALYKKEGIE